MLQRAAEGESPSLIQERILNNVISDFTASLAYENGLSHDIAVSLVEWMQNEGVLDYDILKEVYAPVAKAANDA